MLAQPHRRTYPDDIKEAARIGLLAGQSVPEIADRYAIPTSTVKSYEARGFGRAEPDDEFSDVSADQGFNDLPAKLQVHTEAGALLMDCLTALDAWLAE